MGKIASRRPLLLRFKWAAPRLRPCWVPVSPACCYWQARFTPSIPINVSPSTFTRLGEHKMAPASRHVSTLRKPRTVSSGSYLFPPISTGLTASGFCPGLCLPGVPINRSINIFADHAGGLWVLGARDIVHLKGGVVSSHFQLEGVGCFKVSLRSRTVLCGYCEGNLRMRPFAMLPIHVKCFGKADGIPISDIRVCSGGW